MCALCATRPMGSREVRGVHSVSAMQGRLAGQRGVWGSTPGTLPPWRERAWCASASPSELARGQLALVKWRTCSVRWLHGNPTWQHDHASLVGTGAVSYHHACPLPGHPGPLLASTSGFGFVCVEDDSAHPRPLHAHPYRPLVSLCPPHACPPLPAPPLLPFGFRVWVCVHGG